MTKAKKPSPQDRLASHGLAKDVARRLGTGIDLLPIDGALKAALTYKTADLVATVAETGVALSHGAAEAGKGAAVAARDGVEAFQAARRSPGGDVGAGGDGGTHSAAVPAADAGTSATTRAGTLTSGGAVGSADARGMVTDPAAPHPSARSAPGDDLVGQLERLSALRAGGHLDDREYAAAKDRLLTGDR
jgi:hypothetical protein